MNLIKAALADLPKFALKQFMLNIAVDAVGTFAPVVANLFTRPVTTIRGMFGGK